MRGIKKCCKCGIDLTPENSYTAFHPDRRYRKNICKKCYCKYTSERRRRIKKKAIDSLGNKCVKCGESDWRCLQIDHINGKGNQERKTLGAYKMSNKVLKHPELYQILCANCNWKKRYENDESN